MSDRERDWLVWAFRAVLGSGVAWAAYTLTGIGEEFASVRGTVNTRAAELEGQIEKVATEVKGIDRRVDRNTDDIMELQRINGRRRGTEYP